MNGIGRRVIVVIDQKSTSFSPVASFLGREKTVSADDQAEGFGGKGAGSRIGPFAQMP